MAPTDTELVALAERVGAACRARGWTLGTAESCTGGLVAHLITEVPGSSDYFRGGARHLRRRRQGRSWRTCRRRRSRRTVPSPPRSPWRWPTAPAADSGVDIAVAVTGVAGPGGGTEAKPVGLTYVAIADGDGDDVRRHVWACDRSGNKRASAAAALTLVRRAAGGGSA